MSNAPAGKIRERLAEFFRRRYPVDGLRDALLHKTVPVHRHTLWYYLGGMTLLLILIQFASGILLLLYYRPSAEGAFESVKFIMNKVEFGWLVRSVHAWAANLAILSAFVHMASTFFLKAYRAPRELTWVSGVCLLGLLLGFGFTGYLLPWNTVSYFATKVGTQIAGVLPGIGPALCTMLKGGEDVGAETISRFYWLHIAVLPAGLLLLLGVHLFLVQLQGMSKPPSIKEDRAMPFFPNFLLRDLVAWCLMLGLVLGLSVQLPAELGVKADPFAPTPPDIAPEWYFMWMFQTLKMFPGHVLGIEGELLAIGLISVAGLIVLLVPWLDRPAAQGKAHPAVWILGMLAILYVVAVTGYAYWVQPQ